MDDNALEYLDFFKKSRVAAKSLDPARLSRANAHNHRGSIQSGSVHEGHLGAAARILCWRGSGD
jgi:hypothetical protein